MERWVWRGEMPGDAEKGGYSGMGRMNKEAYRVFLLDIELEVYRSGAGGGDAQLKGYGN